VPVWGIPEAELVYRIAAAIEGWASVMGSGRLALAQEAGR